jgi:hypothetical protein
MRSELLFVDPHDWHARAERALETAREMKPGPERSQALKKAGELQVAADLKLALKIRRSEASGNIRNSASK